MAWETEIPDVIAGEPIESAWGNKIRDQVVHIVANPAALPTVPDGGVAYSQSDDRLYLRRSGAWTFAGPQGQLAYATNTSAQVVVTTEVDLTGLSVTVTTAASRRIRVSGYVRLQAGGASGCYVKIHKDGVEGIYAVQTLPASAIGTLQPVYVDTPTAASHTYKLRGQVDVNGYTLLNVPAWILVEDIGPA